MSVTIHESVYRHLLKDEQGPMGLYLREKGDATAEVARSNVSGRRPRVRTGDLLHSIQSNILFDSGGGIAAVISAGDAFTAMHFDPDYPRRLEEGATASFRYRRGARRGQLGEKYYRYRYLEPALRYVFGRPGGRRGG